MKKSLWVSLSLLSFCMASGFNLKNAIVPRDEILSGGPPKDGIPAILEPLFVEANQAGFLEAEDEVIGVVINGKAKAYPIKILTWHEVVNDRLGGDPIVVTF